MPGESEGSWYDKGTIMTYLNYPKKHSEWGAWIKKDEVKNLYGQPVGDQVDPTEKVPAEQPISDKPIPDMPKGPLPWAMIKKVNEDASKTPAPWIPSPADIPPYKKFTFESWHLPDDMVDYDEGKSFDDEEIHIYDQNPQEAYVERTLVLLKPDSYERSLMGEIITILDGKELALIGAKQLTMTKDMVSKHYKNHVGKNFFPQLVEFMTSGPSFALVYEGQKACAVVRQLIGEKHPSSSPPGSIRGKYASEYPRNLVHGSDDQHEADYEIKLYFDETELFGSYYKTNQKKMEAQKSAELAEKKQIVLAKNLLPGQVFEYPEQIKKDMTITNPSGQAYRVLDVKKATKGNFNITICGTQYVDDKYQQNDYKVTLTYDDTNFSQDNWKLLIQS